MCGIVGVVNRSTEGHQKYYLQVERMLSLLRHRGPDGEGITQPVAGVTLGHVRLAIIDLSTHANQPMNSSSGDTSIVYNGEIYNFRELRTELESLGFRFRTNSDTEVLLNAYEYWGGRFVEKLNGMFAFAIYDKKKHKIILGRDRLGIKPLYYKLSEDRLVFSSELKGITHSVKDKPEIDLDGLSEYLCFQNNYGERTLLKNIFLLSPGTVMTVDCHSLKADKRKFWSARVRSKSDNFGKEREERLNDILLQVMGDQMLADVPVNSFLSGGIDSCAIAALASKQNGRIKTFTCGFDVDSVTDSEALFDERRRAEKMSAVIGSQQFESVLKADDFLALMADWAWAAEEPRVGSSFPNFCISSLASKYTKVCMSGTGGDELFGGYPWRYGFALNSQSYMDFSREYFGFWSRMLSSQNYQNLIRPLRDKIEFEPFESFSDRLSDCVSRVDQSDYLYADAALLFEAETFLHGLLVVEDKASMSHGLEVRVPLLDNRILDFALSTPYSEKVLVSELLQSTGVYGKGHNSMPSFAGGKLILRNVLARYVPSVITDARKQGFSPPFETWFRTAMQKWLDQDVFSKKSPLNDYLDMSVARKIWLEHRSSGKNHRLFIWGMIALYLFFVEFIGRDAYAE